MATTGQSYPVEGINKFAPRPLRMKRDITAPFGLPIIERPLAKKQDMQRESRNALCALYFFATTVGFIFIWTFMLSEILFYIIRDLSFLHLD